MPRGHCRSALVCGVAHTARCEQVQPITTTAKKTDRALHEIARRVMNTRLAARPLTAATAADAMQGSCGELFAVLETSMGSSGLEALIGRALQLTSREYPWLSAVRPGSAADCPLSGLIEAAEDIGAEDAVAGYTAVLATLVSLLVMFIGEDLALRFARHAWPKVFFSKLSEDARE